MMADKTVYYTIDKSGSAEFKDRGSRFIATCLPIAAKEEFKAKLATVKLAHPKAEHFCFAYRIGFDGNNFRSGDDGEPAGTAGKPILGQIDSKELTNTLIIVTRYFGGTLLGIPGLINAYKTAASLALQVTPIVQRPVELPYSLEFDYTMMNEIMVLLRQHNCSINSQEIQLFCQLKVGIPVSRVESVLNRLRDMRNVQFAPGK